MTPSSTALLSPVAVIGGVTEFDQSEQGHALAREAPVVVGCEVVAGEVGDPVGAALARRGIGGVEGERLRGVKVARGKSVLGDSGCDKGSCVVAELEAGGCDGGGVECFVEGGGDGGGGGDVGGCGGGGDVGDGGCGCVLGCVGGEDDVDPVVACLPGLVGEAGRGCVAVDAVAVLAVAERVQGAVAVGVGEVVEVERVVAVGGVVGGEIGGAGADGDRVGEADLLPAARAFAGEGRTREQRSCALQRLPSACLCSPAPL